MIAGPDTEVMGGSCVDVQFRRNAGSLECEIHQHTVLGRADVIGPAVREEDRRCSRRDVQAGGEFVLVFSLQVARIDGDGEVRPASGFVRVIERFVGPPFEVRRGGNRQVATRRETDDADSLGVKTPLRGPATHEAEGPLWGSSSRRGTRYLRMMPVTPIELSQAATSSPSSSQ